MRFAFILLLVVLNLSSSCVKNESISLNNTIAEKIEGKWKAINFLKDDDLLPLDGELSFIITFSNVQENNGDFYLVSKTPNYTGQNVEYVEEIVDSKFFIKSKGTILSILNSFEYEISFHEENLILYTENSNASSIVYEKIV